MFGHLHQWWRDQSSESRKAKDYLEVNFCHIHSTIVLVPKRLTFLPIGKLLGSCPCIQAVWSLSSRGVDFSLLHPVKTNLNSLSLLPLQIEGWVILRVNRFLCVKYLRWNLLYRQSLQFLPLCLFLLLKQFVKATDLKLCILKTGSLN